MVDRSGMTTREFRLAGVSPGTYYWRVRSTSRSGQTTSWNTRGKFTVVRGGESAAIDASEWHVERVGGTVYLITGRTSPGVVVRAQGREQTRFRTGHLSCKYRRRRSKPPSRLAMTAATARDL